MRMEEQREADRAQTREISTYVQRQHPIGEQNPKTKKMLDPYAQLDSSQVKMSILDLGYDDKIKEIAAIMRGSKTSGMNKREIPLVSRATSKAWRKPVEPILVEEYDDIKEQLEEQNLEIDAQSQNSNDPLAAEKLNVRMSALNRSVEVSRAGFHGETDKFNKFRL